MTNLSALFLLIASVAAATHATTFTTTTVYSKVLVALGQYEESSKDVEIIDLSSSETECQKLPNFPRGDFWVSGGLDFQEKPLLCGGNNNPSKCYTYEDGTWKIASSTNTPRTAAAITNFPSQDGGKKLLLTGGLYFSTYLSSTEVLTETGWLESAPMPAEIYNHCMVTISPTSVIAIGGVHNARRSKNSYIYNSESNTWTQLRATLNLARAEHSCGLINRNSQSQEKSVIVAGSYGPEGFARTVEILDLDSMEWREGPDLPVEICCATMVEDPSGGVVLIGGRNENQVFNTLYRLAHAGPDATWVEMPQKLKTARIRHVAFLVPDDITHCS